MHTETAPASPVQNGRETPSRHKGLVNAVAAGTVEFESLIRELMPFLSGTDELPSEIALELSTALIELEAETAADDQLYALVNGHGAAALALAKSGQILAVNAGATELFRLSTGDGLSALQISRDDFEQFTQRLSATSGASLVTAHKVDSAGRRTPVVLSGSYSPGYQAFVLKALQNYWPDSEDLHLACEHHLDVHALERPGYGRTHPPLKNEDILDCHINDILAHMDRCGSAPVGILAHEVGLIPALELALRRPELLCCILAVPAAPPFQGLQPDSRVMKRPALRSGVETPIVLLHGNRNPGGLASGANLPAAR